MNVIIKEKPRLVYLDSLRGFAALWVVFFHMIFLADPVLEVPDVLFFLKTGGMGVTLFFIISAFSLCLTMPRHLERERPFLSFYVHRIFRVVPLFYVIALITIYFFISRGVEYSWYKFVINFSFLFNFIPGEQESIVMAGWTIGVEILFYIIFPFLYFLSLNFIRCFIIFILSMIISYVVFCVFPDTYYKWSILRHAPIFLGGMLIFYFSKYMHEKKFSFIYGVIFLLLFFPSFHFLIRKGSLPYIGYYIQLLPFGCAVLGLSLLSPPVFVSAATAFLGKISYSLYLLHPLVIVYLTGIYPSIYALNFGVAFSFVLCSLITLALLIPLAYISFIYIEKPGIWLGNQIVERFSKKKQVIS